MKLRSAFTLMEVNLAILIMATGVLAMASLYSLGFRESQQSGEDVAGAGYADAFLSPLVAGLSSPEVKWSAWKSIGNGNADSKDPVCDGVLPPKGWAAYAKRANDGKGRKTYSFRVDGGCNTTANGVFGDLMNIVTSSQKGALPTEKAPFYALVATRRGASISLAFRSSNRLEQLMSQPVYYAEVHFQGGDENQ